MALTSAMFMKELVRRLDQSGNMTEFTYNPGPDPKIYDEGNLDTSFWRPPKYVGGWQLPGSSGAFTTTFLMTRKPRWLTIKLMWYIMEWKWVDKEEKH